MRAPNSKSKGAYWGRANRFGWSVLSVGEAPPAKRRWSLRTVLMVVYFSFVIAPIALLVAVLGALLAGLLVLGQPLRDEPPSSYPVPVPLSLMVSSVGSSPSGTSPDSRWDGTGTKYLDG